MIITVQSIDEVPTVLGGIYGGANDLDYCLAVYQRLYDAVPKYIYKLGFLLFFPAGS